MATYTLKLDDAAIAGLVAPGGPVANGVRAAAELTAQRAQGQVGVDTGKTRASINASFLRADGQSVWYKVEATTSYAIYHHQGHGVITPKRGKFLVFQVGGKTVFARKVRAVSANKFLIDPMKKLSVADFAIG